MADDARDAGDQGDRSTDEAALSARLRRLGERLDQERSGQTSRTASGASPTSDGSGLARGLRLSSELVAGVVVGALMDGRWIIGADLAVGSLCSYCSALPRACAT